MAELLPPGPTSALRASWYLLSDPVNIARTWKDEFGEPFTVPTLQGPLVVTGHPEHLQAMFTADPDTFSAFGGDLIAPALGRRSLMLTSGGTHARGRRLLLPTLQGQQLEAWSHLVAEATRARFASLAPGAVFDAHAAARGTTREVLLCCLFGARTPDASRRWDQVARDYLEASHPALFLVRSLQASLGGFSPYARFRRAYEAFDQAVAEDLATARSLPVTLDVLSQLAHARYDDGDPLSDEAVADHLRTFLVAAYETTASALAWASHRLSVTTGVRERLVAEVDAAPDDPATWMHLPWLEAVCREVLRIHPIATDVFRTLTREFRLGSWHLAPGTTLSANVVLAHGREATWGDPAVFRPERFQERSFEPWEFLPFGGGARRCLGEALAMTLMKVTLAATLRGWQLRRHREAPTLVERRGLVLVPKGGVQLVLVGPRR